MPKNNQLSSSGVVSDYHVTIENLDAGPEDEEESENAGEGQAEGPYEEVGDELVNEDGEGDEAEGE